MEAFRVKRCEFVLNKIAEYKKGSLDGSLDEDALRRIREDVMDILTSVQRSRGQMDRTGKGNKCVDTGELPKRRIGSRGDKGADFGNRARATSEDQASQEQFRTLRSGVLPQRGVVISKKTNKRQEHRPKSESVKYLFQQKSSKSAAMRDRKRRKSVQLVRNILEGKITEENITIPAGVRRKRRGSAQLESVLHVLEEHKSPSKDAVPAETQMKPQARKRRNSLSIIKDTIRKMPSSISGTMSSPTKTVKSEMPKVEGENDEGSGKNDESKHTFAATAMSPEAQASRSLNATLAQEEGNAEPENNWMESFVIMPDSTFRLRWDAVMLILVIYYAVTVPVVIGFAGTQPWMTQSSGFGKLVDVCFTLMFAFDIVLNFSTAFSRKGRLVLDHKLIAINYLKFWFIIDFIATFPISEIYMAAASQGQDNDSATNIQGLTNINRSLRLLRVFKLFRVFKISRIMNRIVIHQVQPARNTPAADIIPNDFRVALDRERLLAHR